MRKCHFDIMFYADSTQPLLDTGMIFSAMKEINLSLAPEWYQRYYNSVYTSMSWDQYMDCWYDNNMPLVWEMVLGGRCLNIKSIPDQCSSPHLPANVIYKVLENYAIKERPVTYTYAMTEDQNEDFRSYGGFMFITRNEVVHHDAHEMALQTREQYFKATM